MIIICLFLLDFSSGSFTKWKSVSGKEREVKTISVKLTSVYFFISQVEMFPPNVIELGTPRTRSLFLYFLSISVYFWEFVRNYFLPISLKGEDLTETHVLLHKWLTWDHAAYIHACVTHRYSTIFICDIRFRITFSFLYVCSIPFWNLKYCSTVKCERVNAITC